MRRRFRHWTPRYIYFRLGVMMHERVHPDAPWFAKSMVEILENWLKPWDRGIEWGSGRSTVWFAERVGSLVSVEHNPIWYEQIGAKLRMRGLQNVEYHLCPNNHDYLGIAEMYPPESFDFCLVDGLERDQCAVSAVSLVKPGGIVIVDNCNWYLPTKSRSPFSRTTQQGPYTKKWAEYGDLVESWRRIWTTNGVNDTALWVKPVGALEANHSVGRLEQLSLRQH